MSDRKITRKKTERKTRRENLRITESSGSMLDELSSGLGKSKTEVIEQAIATLYNIKQQYL